MATHFSILAWEIPWTEEPGGLQTMGSQSQTQLSTHAHTVPCDFEIQRQIKRKQWLLSYLFLISHGFQLTVYKLVISSKTFLKISYINI